MNRLGTFLDRLDRIGIKVDIWGNYPWIYLDKVDGVRVAEKLQSEHGFTVAFYKGSNSNELTDIKEIFKVIRKYSIKYNRDRKIDSILNG